MATVLVLGGTVFLGRHVVEAALADGHRVTMFSRGLTQPDLFPHIERIHGDRDGGMGALAGRRWDVVIDTCGFVPRVVAQSMALDAGRYVFVSSISACADLSRPFDETAALLPPVDTEDVGVAYGALKAACERVVQERFGGDAVIVRPGLIGGPHDPTGRFTYWPVRIAEGGDVLAPAPPDAPVQVIDVRDAARWLVRVESGGVYNAVGPSTTMGRLLDTARRTLGSDARLVWVQPEHLAGVEPWTELPLWLTSPAHQGMMRASCARAIAAGLDLRPIEETIRDTLAWARDLQGEPPRQEDGRYRARTLTRAREREILDRLHRPPV